MACPLSTENSQSNKPPVHAQVQEQFWCAVMQVKRMCSPSLLVTNHEAQSFPSIKHEVGMLCQAHIWHAVADITRLPTMPRCWD